MIEYSKEYLERFAPNSKIIPKLQAAIKAGDEEAEQKFMRQMIMPPVTLLVTKEVCGADWIRERGWNTIEADRLFGPDWMERDDHDEMAKKLHGC